jgi:hypothetical protein
MSINNEKIAVENAPNTCSNVARCKNMDFGSGVISLKKIK